MKKQFEENDALVEGLMEGNGCLHRSIIDEDYGPQRWDLLEKDERVVVYEEGVNLSDEWVEREFGLVYDPRACEYVEKK
ncbi:MAG: hypothetical protein ACWGQW_00675 [bacterium]